MSRETGAIGMKNQQNSFNDLNEELDNIFTYTMTLRLGVVQELDPLRESGKVLHNLGPKISLLVRGADVGVNNANN